jgi:hypothetical protein
MNSYWVKLGLEADYQLKNNNKKQAEILLRKCIQLAPDKSWPYFLLSTLVENEEAINLIKLTKKIETTEWYYINLIEKYNEEIDKLKKEFFELYEVEDLKDDSAIVHWHQLNNLSEIIRHKHHGFTLKDVKPFSNKWDCVVLLCTGKEHLNNVYLKFLQHLANNSNIEVSKNLDLKLAIKRQDKDKYIMPEYIQKIFKTAEIVIIDIPDHLDVYDDKADKNEKLDFDVLKKHGSKCGPNFTFFNTIKFLSNYNTSMLLECDCILCENWMNRINNYINSHNFLISGSQSDSPNKDDFYALRNQHINGGTAIYATGNDLLQKFIKLCEELWPMYIKYNHLDLPYDYIIPLVIRDYFIYSNTDDDKILWSYIKKQYVYNSLIFNWSDKTYADFDPQKIKDLFNPAILHQKPTDYPGIFY